MLDWIEDKLNLGCALRFLTRKDVRLSFRIANLIMKDELRWDYVVALHCLKKVATNEAKSDVAIRRMMVKARKAHNDMEESMKTKPNKVWPA